MPEPALATQTLYLAPIGVLLMRDQRITWANDNLALALRTSTEALRGLTQDTAVALGLGVLFDRQSARVELSFPDGSVRQWLRQRRPLTENGVEAHYFIDVTERLAMEEELQQLREQVKLLDTRDSETGLLNNHAILQALDAQITRSRRYGNALSAIRLNLVPPAVDKPSITLLAISQELKMQLRWADLIGRLERNDFLLVLPETPLQDAQSLVQKLLNERMIQAGLSEGWSLRFSAEEWSKGDDTRKLLKRLTQDDSVVES